MAMHKSNSNTITKERGTLRFVAESVRDYLLIETKCIGTRGEEGKRGGGLGDE